MPGATAALVFSPLIVLAAYVIFGVAGFGSTLITVPLLAHLFPLKFVIPVVVLLDSVASVVQGVRLRAEVNRRELLPLLPFMLAGMAAGVLLLVKVPGSVLMLALGLIVLAYGASYLARRESVLRLPRWSAAPIGTFAGITSTLFGIGGPIYVMYLAGRGATPGEIRATMPVVFMFTTVARIALFAATGLFTFDVLVAAALLVPAMAAGLYCGNLLHGKLARGRAVRIIGALLVASGSSLVLRAL